MQLHLSLDGLRNGKIDILAYISTKTRVEAEILHENAAKERVLMQESKNVKRNKEKVKQESN